LGQFDPPSLGTPPGGLDGGQALLGAKERCAMCHDRSISDPGDPLYMPFDGWVSTMMANSVRDPLFQAALSVANQDAPGVGSWCLRCHSPQSFLRGHNVPPDGGAFDTLDTEGVTCDICHRSIAAPDAGGPIIGNAQIYFERSNMKYGPYPDIGSPAHAGTDGGISDKSELCGQCHQVFNPKVAWRNPDDGGTLGPAFPLDTTYDEWKQSSYASAGSLKTCQDCHMPPTTWDDGGTSGFYVAKFGMERDAPRRHAFVGGNLWGLDAVQKNDPANTTSYADQFAETKRLAAASLKSAATLSVSVPDTTNPGGTVLVDVQVKNNTGHKLPTGYADGRRMVIQMVINGEIHTGEFDGGTLIDDPWLRTYEVKHGRYGVGAEDHLAQHDMIVSDTRLPPTGFAPPPGAPTRPVPDTLYRLDDGGYGDADEVIWDVDVPTTLKDGDMFDVTVRLLFQTTTPEYVGFLHDENRTTDRGQNLLDIWSQTNQAAPFEMARVDKHVRVQGTGAGGGSGGGGTAGAGGGSGTGGGTAGGTQPPIKTSCGCTTSGPGALLAALASLAAALRRRLRTSIR
jgi:hypothetical protein